MPAAEPRDVPSLSLSPSIDPSCLSVLILVSRLSLARPSDVPSLSPPDDTPTVSPMEVNTQVLILILALCLALDQVINYDFQL